MNKRLLLISIILIALCSLSAVSANEIGDADTTDGILSVPLEDNVVSADSSINFTKFSENIADNDVVDLSSDVILAEGENSKYSGGIPINKNVTINGNNHIVNGTDLVRIFNIGNNSNVVLKDLVITGALTTSGHGGAIYMATGSLTVENCTFVENTLRNNEAHGGAIYAADRTNLTIKDSVFENNTDVPKDGNWRYWSPTTQYAGAIYVADYVNLNISNTVFKGNKAITNGLEGRQSRGGAIVSTGSNSNNDIVNCTFIDNTATNGIGAIQTRNANITGSVFEGNTANNDWPTIYVEGNSKGTISYNVFLDNSSAQIRLRNSYSNMVEEYNWYATNEPGNMVRLENTLTVPNKFIMLDIYNEGNIVKAGFMKDSNRDDIPDISTLPLREIIISGDVNETAPKLVNGIATVEYTSEITPESKISATIDGYTVDYTLALGNITNIDAIYVENTTVGDDGKIIIYAYGDNGPVNGNATIFLNDTKFDVTIENGMAILNAGSTLDAGIYDIYSYYLGDANYVPSSNKVKSINKFEIKKADVNITYTIDQNSGYITIKISDKVTPTGSTTADVFGNSRTFSGTSIMYDSGAKTLSNGTYLVNITYNGDKNHNVCSLVEEVDLIKNNLTIDISRERTVFTFNLTNEYGIPTGNVIAMFEGSNTFSRTINLNNGVATYDFGSQLHNGTYNLTVTFNGDMNFEKATANGTYDINKLTATIDVDPIIIKVIQTNKNFVVTVVGAENGPIPTGTVSYPSSWSSVSGTLNADGQATLNWEAWTDPYGELMNQSTTITYSGDSVYDSASVDVLFQTTPNLSISSTIDGNNITLSFTCAEWEGGARGTIYIKQNGEDLGNVSALDSVTFQSFKDENLSMGLHNYEFIWDYGNGNNYTFTKSVELREAGESQWAVPGFDNKNSGNPDYTRLDNGFILWNATVNNPISSVVIDSQGNIYLADNSNVNIFFNNGTLKATSQGGSQGAISLIDDQYIIYVRPWNNIAGFDVGTFAGISAYDTQVQWYSNSQYAPIKGEDGRLYMSVYFNNGGMPNGGMYLTMLGIEDNQFTYLNVMINKQPISSPVIDDNGILWINTVGGLYGVDTSSDAVIFSEPNLGIVGRPVISDANIAYVFGKDNTINAVNGEGIVWNVTVNNGIGSVMAIDNENGLLYAVDQNGTLFSYDVNAEGAEVEVYNIGANATSIIVDGDSKVYVSDDVGNVWAFDSEGNLLWNVVLNAPVKAQLAMDKDGVIYAVTQNTLYAIGYRNELAIEVTVPEGEFTTMDNVTITATLNETTEGNVTFTVGDLTKTVNITGNVAEWTTKLPGGNQTITATFGGNDEFATATNTTDVEISKVDVEFVNVPEKVNMDDYASFGFNLAYNNTIAVVKGDNFKVYKDDEELELYNGYDLYGDNGNFNLDLWEFNSGKYNMTIAFAGDDSYNPVNITFALNVVPHLSVNSKVDEDKIIVNVNVGDSVYPYETLSDATGKFTVTTNNETLAEGKIDQGIGSVSFNKLEPGTYNLTVVYDEGNYPENNVTISLFVPKTSQWAVTGYDYKNSGKNNYTRLDGVEIIWVNNQTINFNANPLRDDFGQFMPDYSAVIDSEGIIYITDGKSVYALNDDGTLKYSTGGSRNGGLSLMHDFILFDSVTIDTIRIFDTATRANLVDYVGWSTSSRFPVAIGPDGRVYITSTYGDNMGTGNWIVVLKYENGKFSFDTSYYQDSYTGSSRGGFGLTKVSGTPVFTDDGIMWVSTRGSIGAADISNGKVLFTSLIGVSGRPVVDDANIVYYLGVDNNIHAVNLEGFIWNATITGTIGTTLAVGDDYLYAVNAEGVLYKYSKNDGSESLVADLGSAGQSIIVDANNNIYVSTANGDVYAFDSDDSQLWTINLGSAIIGKLAMNKNGIIYAYTADALYALGYPTELDIASENLTVFDDEVITVTVPEGVTGNITFKLGYDSFEIPINETTATLNLGRLPAGNYTVIADYAGNNAFASANVNTTFEIKKVNPDISEVSIEDNTVTVKLPENATGNVFLDVDGVGYYAPIENGEALINIPELKPGTYEATLTYPGDDNYNNASTTFDIKVPDLLDPELEATAENTTITVTVNKDATGGVIVDVDGTSYYAEIKDGQAIIDVKGLEAGKDYTATVIYAGDDNFTEDETTVKISVPKEEEIEPEDAGMTVDSTNSTITVELPEDATGYVLVDIDGKGYYAKVTGGKATVDVAGLDAGNYTATVTYTGDDNYKANTSSVAVSIPEEDEPIPEPVTPEMTVKVTNTTIEVTLPKDATGNVLVDVNGQGYYAPVKDGKATVNVIGLDEGTYPATVTYAGDDKYTNATKPASVTVPEDEEPTPEPVDPKADINVSDDAVNVELPKDATGYMLVDVDGKGYYAPVKDGKASIDLPELAPGNHTVTVTYTGDDKYKPATANKTVTVEKEIITVVSENLTKIEKAPDRFEAVFTDSDGNALANKDVTFGLNDISYTRTTDANGKAGMNINLVPGTYSIKTTNPVTNESVTNTITVLPRFTEDSDLVKYFRNDSQYVLKVLDDNGNPAKAGEIVTYNINGVFYNRTTNATGHVKLSINLPPKTYIITAEYKGCKVAHNVTVLPTLTGNDLTKKYGQSGAYEAKLVDGQGKAYANQKIEFNINGVMYQRTTDANGVAKLNINLQAGKYIITASYGQARISNTVTVTA